MKTLYPIIALLTYASSHTHAATSFIGATNSDFATAGNWDNDLPGSANPGGDGTIDGGRTAALGTSFAGNTSTLTVGANGSAGTLNINNGGSYTTSNGGTSDVRIGVGAGSVGTVNVNNGGNLSTLGFGADLFLGDNAGGQGYLNIADGGNLDARKAVEVIDGKLYFASGASYSSGRPQDELVIGNNGILGFQTDGSTVTNIAGGNLKLELGSTSTLDMNIGGSYTVGDTWTIISSISTFSGVTGGDGTGVFGSVIDSNNASHQFIAHYGSGLAAADELVIELVAVPEPSSTALLGLAGLGLLVRRRR